MTSSENGGSIRLDARLASVADMIPPNAVVADIGTDHGYLMGYLFAAKIIRRGFACDIHEQPLSKAAATLKTVGAEQAVSVRLSDGLFALEQEDFSHVVIAGMGGDLIFRILSDAPWCRQKQVTYLLQPMTKADHLRKNLWENGYEILREKASVAGGFPYSVMEVRFTGKIYHPSMIECLAGDVLQEDSPEGRAYLNKVYAMLRKKQEGLSVSREKTSLSPEFLSAMEQLKNVLLGDKNHDNTTSI